MNSTAFRAPSKKGAASPQEDSARNLIDSALPAALVTAKYSGSTTDPL